MANLSETDVTRAPVRLLWTFLFYTLAGPFLAGLVAATVAIVAGDIAAMPDTPNPGEVGISIYLWSAIPAALAALMLLPLVWKRGRFGIPEAGIAGVAGAIAYAAFAAGLISIAVRQILVAGNIIAR